jgi:hypothetical protein
VTSAIPGWAPRPGPVPAHYKNAEPQLSTLAGGRLQIFPTGCGAAFGTGDAINFTATYPITNNPSTIT